MATDRSFQVHSNPDRVTFTFSTGVKATFHGKPGDRGYLAWRAAQLQGEAGVAFRPEPQPIRRCWVCLTATPVGIDSLCDDCWTDMRGMSA